MGTYICLKNQSFHEGLISIVPIRTVDRYKIMNWRNEQLYHLRQLKPLNKEDQDRYFKEVVEQLFLVDKPNQLLFSYLNEGICIGYGGLVHINWDDRNAEISFIMDTSLEKNYFEQHWTTFLGLIQKVGFGELGFHKIFTYAFDLRPVLYPILKKNQFLEEAILREHVLSEGKFIDVYIHSKINGSY